MIDRSSLSITVRNIWAKWFVKVPITEQQFALCVEEWSECRSITEVFNALKKVRQKQRGPVVNRLRVEERDDLADVIRIYVTAVLRNSRKVQGSYNVYDLRL